MAYPTDIAYEHEMPDADGTSDSRRPLVAIGAGVLVALIIGIAVQFASEPQPDDGIQRPTGSVVLRRAGVDGWVPLVPTAGQPRSGFPAPMVWRSDRVCIGFARADFGPDDFRPSLARCERDPLEQEMASNEIRSLLSIESGFDTWHFIEAAAPLTAVRVQLSVDRPMSNDRIHLAGSTVALRLEVGVDLVSIEWSTSTDVFRCMPDPEAWRTSIFCDGA